MSKRLRSKYKIDRRLGVNLWGRAKSPVSSNSAAPGQHGSRRTKPTNYGLQLRAKQQLRFYYGNIGEKQFRRLYHEAVRRRGSSDDNLLRLLESRLDAAVYRMKFAPTVFASRQLINHGHILVNARKVNLPSYRLRQGDQVEIRPRSKQMGIVISAIESKERDVPHYLEVDTKAAKGIFALAPSVTEIPYPVIMEPKLALEYYSR